MIMALKYINPTVIDYSYPIPAECSLGLSPSFLPNHGKAGKKRAMWSHPNLRQKQCTENVEPTIPAIGLTYVHVPFPTAQCYLKLSSIFFLPKKANCFNGNQFYFSKHIQPDRKEGYKLVEKSTPEQRTGFKKSGKKKYQSVMSHQ